MTAHYVIRKGAPAYYMYYTGTDASGHAGWSYDLHRAARFADHGAALAVGRSIQRWLDCPHATIAQIAQVAA